MFLLISNIKVTFHLYKFLFIIFFMSQKMFDEIDKIQKEIDILINTINIRFNLEEVRN